MQLHRAGFKSVSRYFKSRGWKDFLFICVVGGLWIAAKHLLSQPSDYAKWTARVKAEPQAAVLPGQDGLAPCFFLVPQNTRPQKEFSDSIGDCLRLLPNGRKLDVFEVVLGGNFLPVKTDLYVPDTIPLAFTRTYVPLNEWSDRFQVYLPHVYDPFLSGSRFPYTYVDWRLPDGQSVHYDRISSGTGFADAIYGTALGDGVVAGSRINWNGFGWDWTLADGTTYLSPEAYNAARPQQGSLVGIFDSNGNEVRLSRGTSGELTEIKSPGGLWIRFDYKQLHLIRAQDSANNVVEYQYDSGDHLIEVKYSTGHITHYRYDAADRIVGVEDVSENVGLEIEYDAQGAVTAVRTDNKHAYNFSYVSRDSPKATTVYVVEPSGKTIRVDIHTQDDKIVYSVQR